MDKRNTYLSSLAGEGSSGSNRKTRIYPPRLTFHNIVFYIFLIGVTLLFPTACEDEPIPEPTPTPQPKPEPEPTPEPTPTDTVKTKCLHIVADWSDALSEADIPTTYHVFIGDTAIKADALYNIMYTDSTSVEPYEIIAYNEPNDVVISGNDAVISMGEDGLLAALPDYLFAGDTTVSVEAGDTALVSLRMRRLLSPITLTLNFTDTAKVADVEATLTGLIASIHLPDGTPTGDNTLRSTGGSTARMAYEALPEDKGIRLLLRTFGIVKEASQILKVTITLADGRVLTFESDLTGLLDDFAHLAPIALENKLDTAKPEEPEPEPEPEPTPEPEPEPTPEPEPEPEDPPYRPPHPEPDPDVSADASGTIDDWTVVEGNPVEAK